MLQGSESATVAGKTEGAEVGGAAEKDVGEAGEDGHPCRGHPCSVVCHTTRSPSSGRVRISVSDVADAMGTGAVAHEVRKLLEQVGTFHPTLPRAKLPPSPYYHK